MPDAFGASIEVPKRGEPHQGELLVGAYWATTGNRRADKGHVITRGRTIDNQTYKGFSFLYADAHPGDLIGDEFDAFCFSPDNSFFQVHARMMERNGKRVVDIHAWCKHKWQLVLPGLDTFELRRVDDGSRVEEPLVFAPGRYHLELSF